MRKVMLKEDVRFNGWMTLSKGTKLNVDKYNSRYVYVKYNGLTLKLTKNDVETVY